MARLRGVAGIAVTEPHGDEEWPPDDGDPFETTVDCWDCGGEMRSRSLPCSIFRTQSPRSKKFIGS